LFGCVYTENDGVWSIIIKGLKVVIESITTSPILQISSNGNRKPRRNAGAIYAFPRIIFIRFADVRCKLL